MIYFLAAAALVILDQFSKFAVRASIPLGSQSILIPHVLAISYIQNTGMAFSSFSNRTAFLTLISALASVALAALLAQNRFLYHPFAKCAITLVLAGAVGNLIDRAAFGCVTDMIELLFVQFAVFNVADCCVVTGGILLALYVLFFWDKCEAKS